MSILQTIGIKGMNIRVGKGKNEEKKSLYNKVSHLYPTPKASRQEPVYFDKVLT
jgi:hypothetical protein